MVHRRLALAAAMVALPAAAHADETASTSLAVARKAIVSGDFAGGRTTAQKIFGGDSSSAERAAAAELMFIADTWASSGGRPPPNPARLPAVDPGQDWHAAFAAARDRLLVGAYDDAATRFDQLVGLAPDLVAAARASELRALARDALALIPPPPTPVEASPKPKEEPAPAAKETRWYGWQTLIVDAGSIALTPLVPPVGIGGYLLGPPLVHVIHGRPLPAIGDFGLRLTLPPTCAVIGFAVAHGCTGFLCELEGAAVGLLVGAGIAIGIDTIFLAREQVDVEKPKQVTIVPILSPTRAGVGGTF